MKQASKSSSLLLAITGVIVVALMAAVAMMTITLVEERSSNAAEPSISCQEFAYTSFDGSNSQGVEAIQHLNETAGEGSVSMDREGPNTFGPEVLTTDVQSVQKTLSAIRLCENGNYVDSHIMAVHMATWTQAMSEAGQSVQHPTSLEEVNSFADKLTKDVALRQEVALELIALESASKASIEEAAKGVWSLYMVDVDEVITIHQGQTIQAGPAIAFKHPSGAKVSYRLGCFFQPFGQKEYPGITVIPAPTPTPPTPTPTPTPPEKLTPKDPTKDSAAQGNAPEGGGQNVDPGPGEYVPPSKVPTPPPVYVPTKPPEVTVTNPDIQVDTTPPPEKEEEAPSVDEPATGCVIPPGETSC